MHGRVKVRTTAEQEELKKIERAKKVVRYKAGINLIFNKRKEGIYDEEILLVTEQMLPKNPDIYTLWNVRREAFGSIAWSKEEYAERLKKELTLTEHCLLANPKSYSVWHQRCWVNDHLPEPDWTTELSLCAKCLNYDERNFHCWDYRRYVVSKAGVPETKEYDFSTAKIESNFSNYSSWHYRSLLLPKIFPDETGQLPIEEDKHTAELDLVMNATFTDPNDTSAWFYQRWLLNTKRITRNILWMIKLTPEKIIVAFDKKVCLNNENTMLKVDGNVIVTKFRSYNNEKYEVLWIAELTKDEVDLRRQSDVELIHDGANYKLEWSLDEESWIYKSELESEQKRNIQQLSMQLENYKQLAMIEPDNKWALLTGIILMKNIDPVAFHDAILNDLSILARIDKLRTRYYSDLRSRYIIDFVLDNRTPGGRVDLANSRVDFSCLDLVTLYKEQYLSFAEEIHLAGNQLGDCLHKIGAFQSCVKLSLSSNGIRSVRRFPKLDTLRFLSLRNNSLSSLDEIVNLIEKNCLTELDIRDNPLLESNDQVVEKLSSVSPGLRVILAE